MYSFLPPAQTPTVFDDMEGKPSRVELIEAKDARRPDCPCSSSSCPILLFQLGHAGKLRGREGYCGMGKCLPLGHGHVFL